jgi:dUTPase
VLLSRQGRGRGTFTAEVGERIAQLVVMAIALPITAAVAEAARGR